MAIAKNTESSKIRYCTLMMFATSNLLASTVATSPSPTGKHKRQLFREHLLPNQGGKIPDHAFEYDRVNLNILNQNGIHSPDGQLLRNSVLNIRLSESRKGRADILKIMTPLENGNRYVAPEGRKNSPEHSDTTYSLRKPVGYNLKPIFLPNKLPLVPSTSLQLLHEFRKRKFEQNSFNEDFKFGVEYSPYLKKLHETD